MNLMFPNYKNITTKIALLSSMILKKKPKIFIFAFTMHAFYSISILAEERYLNIKRRDVFHY